MREKYANVFNGVSARGDAVRPGDRIRQRPFGFNSFFRFVILFFILCLYMCESACVMRLECFSRLIRVRFFIYIIHMCYVIQMENNF